MAVDNEKTTHSNPLRKADFLNKLFFWWLKDIIWYGKTHNIVATDLYDTIPEDLSDPLARILESAWIQEVHDAFKKNKTPSLWKVFTKIYFYDFIKLTAFPICYIAIQTVQPLLLNLIMSYFENNVNPSMPIMSPTWAYIYATIFVVLMTLPTVFLCHGLFHFNRLGMCARIAFSSLIYKKMIRLRSSTNRTTGSSIISLLTTDVTKFELLFSYASFIIIVPVQLLVVMYLIWDSVGLLAAATGIGLLIIQTLPIQVIYSKITLKFRAKQAARTDNRVSLIGEIVAGIKAIKMYVWETYLEKIVYSTRKLEIANYKKISYLTSVVWSITAIAHRPCAFVIMLIYVLQHGMITADKILPVTQHVFNMRKSIGAYFFFAVRSITDMRVSMKRIEDFLLLQEVKLSVDVSEVDEDDAKELISIKGVTASWHGTSQSVLFKNLNLDFAPRNLYAIVGSVGSGKSSFLKLILGELQTVSGKVIVRGRVSYASQEPWLFNDSVKENILFGEKYHEARYEKVVETCALSEDFVQLPDGDETIVGDRGSNLSGGQCARINLARAVYRDADTYLFDDPLSAVDAQVAKKIMKDCINGMLVNKTRVLITHNIQQLDEVEEIILLEHGKIEFRGNMEGFQQNKQYSCQSTFDEAVPSKATATNGQIDKVVVTDKQTNNEKEVKETNELIPKNKKKTSAYLSYIEAGGWNLVSLVILANLLFVMSVSTFDFGLGAWTSNNATMEGSRELSFSLINTILTFGSLVTLIVCTSFLRTFLLYKFTLNASEHIHNCIFSRLMTVTLQFFEANSAGKVLNRFSEDTGIIDNALPQALSETVNVVFHMIAVLLSAVIANWWILIPSSISIIISLFIGKIYVRTIQTFKKLAGSARSPILSFAASSLAGVATIRACKAENIVCKNFNFRQDRYTAAQFLTVASTQAFCLWIEFINLGLLASITYLCVILKNDDTQEGYVGLSLVQVLNVTVMMSFMIKQAAEVLAHMTSVERMLQFTELEKETLIEYKPGLKLPNSWPDEGQVIFKNLYLRYSSESNPVIWDLSCTIEPGSKIGVVGRTGAGKSSLISALFRFAKFDGSLFIDGVDVKSVDLYKLRSKISIIPQEPVLFKSSLRKNLDPANKFDDATLWSALESVELKEIFNSLEFSIERGGSNLSMGQRQLLCLARAIVNENKILILDEATANVDSATDTLIQDTIRRKFKESTVLTIAHRLDTVMDSDKILVLDNGRMVEYDDPLELLQKTDSYFFKMVQQMGESTMQHLTRITKQASENSETHN